jgi:hypothetical protein
MSGKAVRCGSHNGAAICVLIYMILGVKELLGKRYGYGDLTVACQEEPSVHTNNLTDHCPILCRRPADVGGDVNAVRLEPLIHDGDRVWIRLDRSFDLGPEHVLPVAFVIGYAT